MDNVEKVSISNVDKHSENMDHDSPSNVEHVTALMTGIIMGRFGKSHNPSCADFIQSATWKRTANKNSITNIFIIL